MIYRMLIGGGVCLMLVGAGSALADEPSVEVVSPVGHPKIVPLINDNDRVVFLGDSNTYSGNFVAYVDAAIRAMTEQPGMPKNVELINLGLSSETASGLSEPDHPFPRPCVHERLDRVLELAKPSLVVACYGTNDAIYHPFDEGRFDAFKKSMEKLVAKVQAAGARIVVVTPPPFDAASVKPDKLRAEGADQFAWFAPYAKYDEVLAKYAAWETTLKADAVIDLHSVLRLHIRQKRIADPKFVFAPDGVHFGDEGHRMVARVLLKKLVPSVGGKEGDVGGVKMKLLKQRHQVLRDAWLAHVGHQRPGVRPGLPLEEATTKAEVLLKRAYGME